MVGQYCQWDTLKINLLSLLLRIFPILKTNELEIEYPVIISEIEHHFSYS
jgi:hypothetical protein